MPNIGSLLRDEIRRLAKREARALTAGLRRDGARLKRTVAEHRRRLAALERNNKRLMAEADARLKEAVPASPEEVASARLVASRVRALRKRLRLSQAEFGQLLGVSPNTVFVWESKQGRLTLRDKAKAAIVAARKLTARDARRKIELLAPKPAPKTRRRRGRRG